MSGFGRALLASLVCVAGAQARAQQIRVRQSTADSIVRSVEGQAALMRAEAEKQVKLAEARKLYAEATSTLIEAASAGIDLEMKAFESYWERKRERNQINWQHLEERIENARKPMILDNARKVAVWERTIEGELNDIRPSIYSGSLLNRIAQQIDSETGLSDSEMVSPTIAGSLSVLDDRSLKALNLRVSSINGPVDVALASPMPDLFTRWPYLFLDAKLSTHAYRVNQAAAPLFAKRAGKQEKYEVEKRALASLADATNAFYRMYPPGGRKGISPIESRRIHSTEQFLQELKRTISNVAEIDREIAPERESYFQQYEPQRRNAATLIQYMMKHGLEFQKASAGTEHVYERLFLQFRQLARELRSAPKRDSIEEPIIDLDLDALISDERKNR